MFQKSSVLLCLILEIGGKKKVHVSWASRHQEINGKMKGTFMLETEPSLMFSFEILREIRSEKDSTN